MAWFVRFTRFASTHFVYAQEAANSCGIASVMMAVLKINKWTLSKALYVEKEVYKTYTKVIKDQFPEAADELLHHKHDYDGSFYTYASILAEVLNKMDVGTWKAKDVGKKHVAKEVIDAVDKDDTPIILLTNWMNVKVGKHTKKKAGGHFVLVDDIFDPPLLSGPYASVCDPWDGDVHITKVHAGHTVHYAANEGRLSWSVGGYKHEYTGTSNGHMNGWVVRCVG
jgi:hypothetical protein